MSEYNEKSKDYDSEVKPSRIINSIGGKQRKQTRGGLTFSPDWMILPKTIKVLFPDNPFFFFYTKQFKCNSLNTKFQVIKSQIVAKQSIYQKIVLPFSIAKKYNNSLQSFVQNIVFI